MKILGHQSAIVRVVAGLAWAALGGTLFFHLWVADRGLEMTDEASYFLIALDPWHTCGHGTFHGFLLRPLYLLAGESVAGLRWLGYAIVMGASWRLAGAVRLILALKKSRLMPLCAPVLMTAALTCYSAGMRTPCYNWLILVGAMLAWSGWLRGRVSRFGPLEFGFGLMVAFWGKWGAGLILLGMFIIIGKFGEKSLAGFSRSRWAAALLTLVITSGVLAIYAGTDGIRNTLQAGILIAQTTGSHGWFLVPKYSWEIFYYFYRISRAYIWLLPAILVFWCLARHNPKKWTVEKIAAFLFAVGLSLAALRGWWRGGIEQFGKESVLAGCWLLGVAWTVWAVKRRTEDNGQRRDDGPASHEASQGLGPSAEDGSQGRVGGGRSLVLWGVVATPFLSGIGTNTSIADYAGQGTIFFLTVGFLLIGLLSDKQLKGWALVALVGICFLQASRVSSSLLQMYRVGSVLRQTKLLEIGPEAGRLRVDSATAGQISSLNEALVRYGFHRGDPVIGVDGLCGLVYLSGGTSPGVPWFFAGQHNYLRGVLQKLPKETLAKSWVLIRSGTNLRDLNSWWNPNDVPPPGFKAKLSGFEIDPTLTEDILLYAPISRREPCDP